MTGDDLNLNESHSNVEQMESDNLISPNTKKPKKNKNKNKLKINKQENDELNGLLSEEEGDIRESLFDDEVVEGSLMAGDKSGLDGWFDEDVTEPNIEVNEKVIQFEVGENLDQTEDEKADQIEIDEKMNQIEIGKEDEKREEGLNGNVTKEEELKKDQKLQLPVEEVSQGSNGLITSSSNKDRVKRGGRAPLPIQIGRASPSTSVTQPTITKGQDNVVGIEKGQPMGLPTEYDITIFEAAQTGNVVALEYLIERDSTCVYSRDSGNVTALHWASINNRLEAARYLIKNLSDVDAVGGDLNATPLHWACRQGLLDMMVLLVQSGADVTLRDSQGFNIIHLSVHAYNLMSLVYCLSFSQLNIDEKDYQGHTALMWSSYQGFPLAVDVLLANGAQVNTVDNTRFTAMHWACVKGSQDIMVKLIQHNADLLALDVSQKTPKDTAVNSQAEKQFTNALTLCRIDLKDLSKKKTIFEKRTANQILFAIPFILIPTMFYLFYSLPWAMSLPFSMLISSLTFNFGVKKVLRMVVPHLVINECAIYPAIFLISCLQVLITFTWTVLPNTFEQFPLINFFFSCLFATALYFFTTTTLSDPGVLAKNESIRQKSKLIQELARASKLSHQNFCFTCLIQRPIRSKHCKFCNHCTARFDHHCPWNFNCVGANNHKDFLLFTISLAFGIILFLYLSYQYLITLDVPYVPMQIPCVLDDTTCAWFQTEGFLMSNCIWVTIQLIWLIILVTYQSYLIAVNKTTNEALNATRYSHRQPDAPIPTETSSARSILKWFHPKPTHSHQKYINPYNKGVIGNCMEFWAKDDSVRRRWRDRYDVPNNSNHYPLNEIRAS